MRDFRSGNPNDDSAPVQWPRFTEDDDRRLRFDPDYDVLQDYRAEQCELWKAYRADQ